MSEQNNETPLLTTAEQITLKRISQGEAPFNQRAQALLAVDEGKSEEEAGELSGLRATQVRYWLRRFGTMGLAIFPDEQLVEVEQAPAAPALEIDEIVEETAVIDPDEPAPQPAPKKEKKQTKKDADKDKSKKSGKVKKNKKDSKDKKKSKKDSKDKKKGKDKKKKSNKEKKGNASKSKKKK